MTATEELLKICEGFETLIQDLRDIAYKLNAEEMENDLF